MLWKKDLLKICRSHLLTRVSGLPTTVGNASKNELLTKFLKGALKFYRKFSRSYLLCFSAIQEFSNSVLLEFISFGYFYIPKINKDLNKYKMWFDELSVLGIVHLGELFIGELSVGEDSAGKMSVREIPSGYCPRTILLSLSLIDWSKKFLPWILIL